MVPDGLEPSLRAYETQVRTVRCHHIGGVGENRTHYFRAWDLQSRPLPFEHHTVLKNPPRFLWEGSLIGYVVRLFLHRASERTNIFAAEERAHILLKGYCLRVHLRRLSFGCVLVLYSLLFT